MAQLNVRLTDDQMEALRRYAEGRRTPVSWLIKDYVDHLLQGGDPVTPDQSDDVNGLSGERLAALAQRGGAFDWLADEPDIYSASDGEPV